MEDAGQSGNSGGPRRHLLFVWKATGYELAEQDGEPPAVGQQIEVGDVPYRVSKLGPSPLPGDARPCAYLQRA